MAATWLQKLESRSPASSLFCNRDKTHLGQTGSLVALAARQSCVVATETVLYLPLVALAEEMQECISHPEVGKEVLYLIIYF